MNPAQAKACAAWHPSDHIHQIDRLHLSAPAQLRNCVATGITSTFRQSTARDAHFLTTRAAGTFLTAAQIRGGEQRSTRQEKERTEGSHFYAPVRANIVRGAAHLANHDVGQTSW